MGFFGDGSADAYERAITAAETDPRGLTTDQKEKLRRLSKESGERGGRARRALEGR